MDYLEDGTPITDRPEFQRLTEEFQDDGTYWLVPGVVQRHQARAESEIVKSTSYEHLPNGVQPEDIHGDEPDFQEQEFQEQISAHRERNGSFPWER